MQIRARRRAGPLRGLLCRWESALAEGSVRLPSSEVVPLLLLRLALLALIVWVLLLLPSPTQRMPVRLKNGIVVAMGILGIGKILYDTLYYDRYRP